MIGEGEGRESRVMGREKRGRGEGEWGDRGGRMEGDGRERGGRVE